MISLTRLNGVGFALNPDLLERVEATPDTVVHLVDGGRFVVAEPLEEVVASIRSWRASVLAEAHALEVAAATADAVAALPGQRHRAAPARTTPAPVETCGAAAAAVVPMRRRRP